jgi:peptidoglycan hydrolase-like amidase
VRARARRARLAALVGATALAVALAALPAAASRTVLITGGGWGHGIGMSQYGAYGRALKGQSPRAILKHYYTGVSVRRARIPRRIRVGLLQYRDTISFRSSALGPEGGALAFKVRGAGGNLAKGPSSTVWRVEASSTGGIRLYRNGRAVAAGGRRVFGGRRGLVVVYRKFSSVVRVAGKGRYALGRLVVDSYPSASCNAGYCLRLVASLSMQHYMLGLGEVPASWPQAVLRAQAIAGRTYAYAKALDLGQHRYPCDCAVYDSTQDQAYIGDARRTGSGPYWDDWKAAVRSTKGVVIKHRGKPIEALYSASSGGHTENNENVWGGPRIPYLRGVRDRADAVAANPNHRWGVQLSWRVFGRKLRSSFGVGRLKRFRLVRPFGVSGRVTVPKPSGGGARIVGARRTVRVSGWSVRSALDLKDSLFRVKVVHNVAAAFEDSPALAAAGVEWASGPPYEVPGGRAQDFDRGRLTLDAARGVVVWQEGPLLDAYDRSGGARGPLGGPVAGARSTPEGVALQRFEDGTLYDPPGKGPVVALTGAVDAAYRRIGGPGSRCGAPRAEVRARAESPGVVARFERGTISSRGGVARVACG